MDQTYPRKGYWIARTYDEHVEWHVGNLLYHTPEWLMGLAIETLKRLGPEMYMEIMEKYEECRKACCS